MTKTSKTKPSKPIKLNTLDILQKVGFFADEITIKVIKLLEKQKAISEEKIAETLKLKVNQTRKLLYSLMERGVTKYEKKKDKKKKWWYVYFWSLDAEKIGGLVKIFKTKELEKKRRELEEEKKYEFECKNCQKKYLHEDALESEYLCPECGATLEPAKTSSTIRKLEAEIKRLEADLAET